MTSIQDMIIKRLENRVEVLDDSLKFERTFSSKLLDALLKANPKEFANTVTTIQNNQKTGV